MASFISPLSVIDASVKLEDGVSVWHFAQLRDMVIVGRNTIIGKSVYIGSGVQIGKNCKIQNLAQIYEPAEIADNVFIGPGAILTNDREPRATNLSGTLKLASDWNASAVRILEGASIGANVTCIAPLTIGQWSMVGAGSVVTKDVANYSLVAGNPAKHIGWVGRSGKRLVETSIGKFKCQTTGQEYALINNEMVLNEEN